MIKKCYLTILLVTLTFYSSMLYAQSDELAVKSAVNRLFDGMKKADTAMISSAFATSSIMQTVVVAKDGSTRILGEPVDSFLFAIAKPHSEIYDEQITFEVVKIDGELASVWAPYRFYLGTKFSHCGVDSFQLAKVDGQWKIIYLVDTRRKQGCQ